MESPGENNMLLWNYSTLVRRSNQFFMWDGTRYLLWVLPDTRGRLLYDVWHSSKTPLPDTVVRHFWKTLTNDASSFGELMTKQNYSHHRHVVLYYAILLSSAIHEFAWIPQNHHIGSVRVEVRPRNVKLWNKFPCSAKYRLRWLPTSCLIGCRARMDPYLIWPIPPYGSTSPFPHIGDLHKPWKSRHWDSDAFHGCTGWPGVKGNRKP